MPNTTTLLSEYAPQRKHSMMIRLMVTGFNLGSALIGFAAAWLTPAHGRRAVLLFGGALPLPPLKNASSERLRRHLHL